MLIVIIAILFIVWVVHDFKKAGAESRMSTALDSILTIL